MARRVRSALLSVAWILFALGPGAGRAALAGTTTHNQLPFTNFTVQSPCNGEVVPFNGDIDVIVHGNQTPGGVHVVISDNVHGTGTGSQGNDYILSAQGNDQFEVPTVDGVYVVPFHAEIISEGAAPNFSVEGADEVIVSGGQVTSFFLLSVTSTTCEG
jgi:hypothetical protein